MRRFRFRRILMWSALGLLVLFGAIQLVPYGRDHSNPVGGRPIAWDSPRTEQLMTDACMDCHSNETKWPWYSNVAPVSWLVEHDVEEGRAELNLSTGEAEVDEMIETIHEGSMPPWQYKPTHPGASLSGQEKDELIRGLEATFGPGGGEEGER
ncbi:MAG TPA: heme-binding domain-containing protein [Gaiellaceae bacterium]|nr:heme-binding domain-containing protein [Gaiellaceae bacterium]